MLDKVAWEKSMKIARLEKVVAPTRLDFEPVGSVWTHCIDPTNHNIQYYIQISDNPEQPEWLSLGDLLAKALQRQVHTDGFIEEHIKLYRARKAEEAHFELHYRLVSEALEKKKNPV